METRYVPAREAWRKLNLARGLNTAVYMYGSTGYGKTTMVQQFLKGAKALWLDGHMTTHELLEKLHEHDLPKNLVVDDTQLIRDEAVQDELLKLITQGSCWLVMLSRTETPEWLLHMIPGMKLVVIREEDLRLTEKEIAELAVSKGLTLTDTEVAFITRIGEGNVLAILLGLEQVLAGEDVDKTLVEQIDLAFGNYLERFVINRWESAVQDFLEQVCVVDSFTIPLAEAITGDDHAALLVEQSKASGNILYQEGETYRVRQVLLNALRRRAIKHLGRRRVNQCLYNAARYYELRDEVIPALELYEQCGEKECIKVLLVRNARRHPGEGFYYELRRHYMALTDEEINSSPILMAAVSMVHSILMDVEKSEYWYARLKDFTDQAEGGSRQEAMSRLLYLDIALPHRGTVNLVSILKSMPSLLKKNEASLPVMSVTSNQPSLMNGGKDFCEWSKQDKLLAETIGTIVERLMGRMGAGLVACAMGESSFEKGADHYTVLAYLTRSQSESESCGTIEMTFVAIGLQVRLALSAGNTVHAIHLLDGFEKRVRAEAAVRLLPNLLAIRCRVALLEGDIQAVQQWMQDAPDETAEFNTMERYRYLTKVRCYLALGKAHEALSMLERLLVYAQMAHRTYISMECGLLRAITQRMLGMDWEQGLLDTLAEIASYRFIRLVVEEGAAIQPLLQEVRHAFLAQHPGEKSWMSRVMTEIEHTARRFPGYLRQENANISSFSPQALSVLRMQAEGLSTREIAEQLHLSQRTVKYHAAENYRKLGAKGMVEAVQLARTMGLL